MSAIKIKKGLDIPIKGRPQGDVRPFKRSGESSASIKRISLNLSEFNDLKFSLILKLNDKVRIGDPIAEDRSCPGRMFVSPAAGTIVEIRRGLKRSLLDIVIERDENETFKKFSPIDPKFSSRDEIIKRLLEGGGFSRIKRRPFDVLADPRHLPRTIFVKAIESLPFNPPPEMQVSGNESLFQIGLDALKKMSLGEVHLVYKKDSPLFKHFKNVQLHTAEGPHPIANPSLHIQEIDPILSNQDIIWTIDALDVLILGSLLVKGQYYIERVIGIGGPACLSDQCGFFKVREGFPIEALIAGRASHGESPIRIISGDVLTGHKAESDDFLGFFDYACVLIRENTDRQMLHFLRLGSDKFTASRSYLSGFFNNPSQPFDFTTSQHGEKRPFIDGAIYDKVMPLHVPTVNLVKAVMAEDYELAENLGLLEVVPEDFALPSFIDPSKIEMTEIIKNGLKAYSKEVLQ